jgi:MbtH protein
MDQPEAVPLATNPFEDDDRRYVVLVNDRRQQSLWPADVPAPAGWTTAHGEDSRQACLHFVADHANHLRTASPGEVIKDFLTEGYSAPMPRRPRRDAS